MRSRYGPHRDPAETPTVVVLRPVREGGRHEVPIHPAILRQRAQLNDLAYFGFVTAQNSVRASLEPVCSTCSRRESVCLSSRHGDDDHLFTARSS